MVLVDGTNVGDMNLDIMHQRERLADSGVIVITLMLDKDHHGLIRDPQIIHYGLMSGKETPDIEEDLRRTIIEYCGKKNSTGTNNIEKNIEQIVRKFIYNTTHRSPWVIVNPFYF